jgi:predicted metalloprotease
MDRIQYIVTEFQGRWFVMLLGKRHGPYDGQRAAIEDAIRGAQTVPGSQVLVETADNQVRTEWTHGTDPDRYPPRG